MSETLSNTTSDAGPRFVFSLHRLHIEYIKPAFKEFKSRPSEPTDELAHLSISKPSGASQEVSELPLKAALEAVHSFNQKKRGDLNYYQQEALRELDAWNAEKVAPHITDTDVNKEEVRLLILTYSRLFFLSRLETSNIQFTFEKLKDKKRGTYYGEQMHKGGTKNEIRVHPGDWTSYKGVKDHSTALLGTLFHESTHAYFAASCCVNHKTPDCKDKDHLRLWHPESQHPFAWFVLAAGAEIALHRLADMGTDLAVFRSLAIEYRDTKVRASAGEWKLFFELYSWDEIDYLIGKVFEEDFEMMGKYLAEQEDVVEVFMDEYKKAEDCRRDRLNAHYGRL